MYGVRTTSTAATATSNHRTIGSSMNRNATTRIVIPPLRPRNSRTRESANGLSVLE